MSDWTAGYVADVGYTFGYYTELNPLNSTLALLNAGIEVPSYGTACELGYGQGLATNIHAAASNTHWYGTDFNPSQAAFAQELSTASGAAAAMFDQSFADFCSRSDLPDFDFIALHGIWSWISEENRLEIVDFIRRKLKVGGILYISYNTYPGWASFAPLRHLMTEHAQVLGTEGKGIVSRIDGALEFTERLLATNPVFSRVNPFVSERTKKLKDQNRHYLAHEYFNRDWLPMHFATMAECLEPAKVQFACSAHYLDHVPGINLTAEQQSFLNEIPDLMFKETVKDFMVNQPFRRDYWVKGLRRLNPLERVERLRLQKVMLLSQSESVPRKVTGMLGEADLNNNIYEPLIDLMADHQVRTLGQIESVLKEKGVTFPQLIEAILVMTGSGHMASVQDEVTISKAKKKTDLLNARLMKKACGTNDLVYLASPVIGGGFRTTRFNQLFLLAIDNGKRKPGEWAQFAWEILQAQGQLLVKEGKTLESPADNLLELTEQANAFAQSHLPILKALLITSG